MISTKKTVYKIAQKIASLESTLTANIATISPIGAIQAYAGSTAPTKWLICDGSAVSRTTYSLLFNAIGTTFGSGDGSSTFNLPDLRGRTPLGAGSIAASTMTDENGRELSITAGQINKSLGEMGGESYHTQNTAEMARHRHDVYRTTWGDGPIATGVMYDKADTNKDIYSILTMSETGQGKSMNNLPPYTTVNYIIYAGA